MRIHFYILLIFLIPLGNQIKGQSPPNIILIMADDLGIETLGCYGNENNFTPHLDKLARAGMRFENCHSSPLCTPSRVKIMTGQYNFRNYIGFGLLKPGETTFAHLLHQAGYKTCVAGKWQLYGNKRQQELAGGQKGTLPREAGFEKYCLWQVKQLGSRYKNPTIETSEGGLKTYSAAYGPNIFVDYIETFMEDAREEPFFVYYPMCLTHDPFEPTPFSEEFEGYDLQNGVNNSKYFSEMVNYMDHLVGRIVKKVENLGLTKNTIIMFVGDNGTDRDVISRVNGVTIKGNKGATNDAGTHVPFIANWEGVIRPNSTNQNLIDFTDFVPSLLELSNQTIKKDHQPLDGISFVPQLTGNDHSAKKREWIFCHYAPNWGNFQPQRYVFNKEWKLYDDGTIYNLSLDIRELNPLTKDELSDDTLKIIREFEAILARYDIKSDKNDGEILTPNILLINIDDMGWRDVGFMGSEFYETPNLDALAAEGMIFTNAYASASNCAPSRACMMSGQWTPRHGIYTVDTSERGQSSDRKLIPTANNTVLPDSQYTLAEALQEAGYTTCHAGKWHLGDDPTTQGFEMNIGGSHAGNPGSYYPPYTRVALEAPENDYYLTNLIMDKTLAFLQTVKSRPFFLYYAPYAVHTPIHPVKALLPKYEDKPAWNGQNNAGYATMIENLDTQIGRLINTLQKSGKLENTFILFTSDNGGYFGVTKQWPLRSGKGSYYEGGIREPMFACWPGKIEDGAKSDIPVTHLDFFPTILEVAGIKSPSGKVLDGQSLLPLLAGKGKIEERPLFWHFPIYLEANLKRDNSTQDPLFRTRPGSAVRLGDWKLIQYFENNDLELYNLHEDISEKENLAKQNPEKLKELLTLLEQWRQQTNAPVPMQLNPDYKKEL